jgi:hypothetical protein
MVDVRTITYQYVLACPAARNMEEQRLNAARIQEQRRKKYSRRRTVLILLISRHLGRQKVYRTVILFCIMYRSLRNHSGHYSTGDTPSTPTYRVLTLYSTLDMCMAASRLVCRYPISSGL